MNGSVFGVLANGVFARIENTEIIPVVTLNDVKDAVPLARALIAGGLPAAEITFRTNAAEESIRRIKAEFPDMLVGAGTVLTAEQADKARDAGAEFAVSPGLNMNVVKHCIDIGFPFIPGCMTPSDIERALEAGLDVIKFFPAQAAGGLPMLKALSAPYPNVRFMPTGGITPDNLTSYLTFEKVIAVGGSFMVSNELVSNGNFEQVTRLTELAVNIISND